MGTLRLTGNVQKNAGAFSKRIRDFKTKFVQATHIPNLHEGTLNVWVDECVAIWPEFMIEGKELDKTEEDYLFEKCKIIVGTEEYEGFRVRPYHRPDGSGGNGDNCLEIIAEPIPNALPGAIVILEFVRHAKP